MCKRGDHHVLQAAGGKKRPLFWYFFSNVAKRSYTLEAAVPFTFFFFSWCSPKIMINELPHCLSIPWERGKDRASCEWCASHCYVTLSRYMYVYCSHWHPYIRIRILWIRYRAGSLQNFYIEDRFQTLKSHLLSNFGVLTNSLEDITVLYLVTLTLPEMTS